MSDASETGIRLQKILAAAGVGSRRRCEELIELGKVSVNGSVVEEQGMRIDPSTAIIRVNGELVVVSPDKSVVALNKPAGMVSSMSDDRGRPCVGDLVADREQRLFHVGRLDSDTEGLLLMTNDGELTQRLTHPSFGVEKTYLAQVSSDFTPHAKAQLLHGVVIDQRACEVSSLRVIDTAGDRTMVELVIHEGRNRIVRRIFDEVGFPVQRLVRTKFGPIRLGNQRPGTIRDLDASELSKLYELLHSQP